MDARGLSARDRAFLRESYSVRKKKEKKEKMSREIKKKSCSEEEKMGGYLFSSGGKKWGEIRREDFAIKAINIICLYGSRMKICRRWRPMYLGEKITQDFIHHRFREREIRIFNSQIVRYKRDS